MITRRTGFTRLLGLFVGPLFALTAACTATVSGPDGNQTGMGPNGTPNGDGTGATGGSGGGQIPNGGPSSVGLPGTPLYSRFLRLTNSQWENSVHDILKLSGPTGQSQQFLHAVSGVTDFENNERVVFVDNANWSDFQLAAEAVAGQVTATDQALQAVVSTTDVAQFIKTFGRRAFRRDLSADEVTSYTAIHQKGAAFSGSQSAFTKGAALVITAMLQSPHFLYRIEMSDDGKPLTGYEMAAKLSLWIRNTTPTDAMLDAASKGSFDSAEGAVAQAKTMLEDPAAVASMRAMHTALFKLELFDTITKDAQVEGFSEGLKTEFNSAATSFFDFIYTQNLGVRDIFTSQVAFAGPLMAKLYGVTVNGSGVQQIKLTDRMGWYTQAPFLTQWSVNNDPDSIHRGVRINLDSLCLELGPPAANLPPVPAIAPNQTNRIRYTELTKGCGGACHNTYINPVGFAFEDYDGLGRFRTTDHGQPVDTTGSYPFSDGTKNFSNSTDLMQTIAASPQAHQCWSKKLATYALERDIVDAERPLVEALGAASAASGASLKQVALALVQNDAFRTHVGGAK